MGYDTKHDGFIDVVDVFFWPATAGLSHVASPNASAATRHHQQAEHSNHFETVRTMATKADKSTYRYSDFYCFMSLADFAAYVDRDDEDGGDSFQISRKSR
ncbi:hypothetical protein [Pseudarthrobacter sp. H2]|uniref:hypothetical protein n=1 Tax=Pseudarthrobacter sp. H2 TaxID=3418415 RepID=UPI003CEA8C22